jgi:DNA-binding CsgD family transcriptional regulator
MNNFSQSILQPGAIEFYAHNGTAHALVEGKQLPISEWPLRVVEMITRDMDRHPGAINALERMGLHLPVDQLNQYVLCMYGELNLQPDFVNFRTSTSDAEFTQLICGTKDCKYRGILCRMIHADYGDLTDREVEICRLLAGNNTAQDIAGKLGISVNTVNTHITNILPKVGVRNSKAVAAWAAHHLSA